jgi:hypothetical protein
MIAHRDFLPQQLAPAAFLKPAVFEPFAHTLEAANAWIRSEGIEVVNVETVVLPNLWISHRPDPTNPSMVLNPQFAEACNQFIRVWYRSAD